MSIVPVIDVSALVDPTATQEAKMKCAQALGKACEEIGFIIVTGHHVSNEVVDNMWKATKDFFDLPIQEKSPYEVVDQNVYPFGYNPVGSEVLSKGKDAEKGTTINEMPPDLKEMFSLGPKDPRSGFPARIFPKKPTEFESAWTVYYDTLAVLASRILEGFALTLELEPHFFEKFIDHHASALRAINYPAIPLGQEVLPGQLRASAHTDYGTITILRTDGPGLQVSKDLDPPVWHNVPYVENAFVINLGDLMRRWTNERWVSTLHRVVISASDISKNGFQEEAGEGKDNLCRRRQSIAFFHNLNRDAEVKVILTHENEVAKHEPIIAGDFLMQKHLASIGMKK
jgi:isopenicillin N synthase-like dioxygenase